jgi:hypothetical protein
MRLNKKGIISIMLLILLPTVNAGSVDNKYKNQTITGPWDAIVKYITDQEKLRNQLEETHMEMSIYGGQMIKLPNNSVGLSIRRGASTRICPLLFAGKKVKRFKEIEVELYDPQGNLLKTIPISNDFRFSSRNLAVGDYKIHFSYKGNKKDKLAPCSTDLILKIYSFPILNPLW